MALGTGMQVASLFAKVSADVTDFGKGMNQVKSELSVAEKGVAGLQKSLGVGLKVAAGVALAGVGALTAGIGTSVKAAADMEQGIADIGAMMNLTTKETAQLQDHIMDLGLDPKLKVSATEASGAVMALGTAGLTMTEIMGGASKATVLLANATGLKGKEGFASAASIATDVMAQFNITADEMDSAVSAITGVTVASKFSIDDYRYALGQAGGIASSVGMSFEDFNATLAAVSPYFDSGGQAATAMKTFLQRLIPTTAEAKEEMIKLGLSTGDDFVAAFFTAEGAMRSSEEIAKNLGKAFGGLSEAQKNQAASTIFGTDAMTIALALAKGGEKIVTDMKTAIGNVDAEELAEKRMNTLSGSWEIFQGIIETLTLGLGNAFIPVIRLTVDWLARVAQDVGPLVIGFFQGFMDKIATIIPLLKDQNFLYEDGSGILMELSKAFGISEQKAQDFWSEVFFARQKVTEFIKSIWDNIKGFVDWNAVIMVVMEALPPLWHNFLLVVKAGSDFIAMVKALLSPIAEAIGKVIGWNDVLGAVAILLSGPVLAAIGSFIAAMSPVIATVAAVSAAIGILRWAWQNDFAQLRTITENTLNRISQWFYTESGIWKGTLADTLKYIDWWANWGWRDSFYNPVVSWVMELVRDIKGYWKEGIRLFLELTHNLWVDGMWIFNSFRDDVKDWIMHWTGYVTKEASDWWGVFKSDVNINLGRIQIFFTQWKDKVVEIFVAVWDGIQKAFHTASEWVAWGRELIEGLWEGIKSTWGRFVTWFSGSWDGLVHSFREFFGIRSPSTLFKGFGEDLMYGFQQGIADGQGGVSNLLINMGHEVTKLMADITGAVTSNIGNTMTSIVEGVRYGIGQVNLATADVVRASQQAEAAARAAWEKLRIEAANPITVAPPITAPPRINPNEDTNMPPPQVGPPPIILPPIINPPTPDPLTFSEHGLTSALMQVLEKDNVAQEKDWIRFYAGDLVGAIDQAILGGTFTEGMLTNQQKEARNALMNPSGNNVGTLLDGIQTLIQVILQHGLGSNLEFNINETPGEFPNNRFELKQLVNYLQLLHA